MSFQAREATFLCVTPEIMTPPTSFRGVMWFCGMERHSSVWVTTLSCLLLTADQGWTILVCRTIICPCIFCPSLSCTHSYRGHSPCWGSQAKMALYFISIYLITIGGCAAILNMVTGVYRDIGDIIIYSYTTHIHRKSMKWSVTLLFCKLQTPHQHSWGCFLTNQPVSSEQMRL